MSEWRTARVGDVAMITDYVANGSFESLRNNVTYRSAPDYAVLVRLVDHNAGWNGNFVYVDRASYEFLRKSSLVAADIVIANVGANAGTVFRVPDLGIPMTLGPNAVLCRPKDESVLQRDFFYYFLISPEGQNSLESIIAGSAQPKFNKTDFRSLGVPVPSLSKQRAVASILCGLDDKIDLNRRMNETLEAMARAIFKDWFIDFGPVRAKLEGRAPYLAPKIWALFPDRLDDGGKPEGWENGTLGEHMVNFDSKRVPVSGGERAKRQGPYPYHGATGVMDHVDDYLFDGIYLLIGEDGSVVRENGLAFTQYVWGKIWVNNHAHVLQGKDSVSTEQLLMYFQHEPVAPYVTGAVQPKLSQGRMNSMPFVYAGEGLCRKFSEVAARQSR